MAIRVPTVSQIRGAKGRAVGGGRKRCRKGKNCSAACIQAGMSCLVEMPESVGAALGGVRKIIQSRSIKGTVKGPKPVPAQLRATGENILKELRGEKAAGAPAPNPVTSGGGTGWRTKFGDRGPAVKEEFNKLSAQLKKLPPEQRGWWESQIDSQMNAKLASRNGTPYSPEKTNKSLISQAKAWQYLIENGPPKELVNRIGEKRPAPSGMLPDVTSSGQRKWIAPDNGLKYSLNKGQWRQNRVSKADTDRRLPDITEFRKSQRVGGAEWPTQKLPPREGLPKTVNEVINSLSQSQKNAIVFNGLDATGNEGIKLRQYYNANPAEKEARLKEIVQRWHDQGGRSGVSGKPVALPGLEPKPGEERSSVDHFQPISTNRAKELPAADMRRIADNYKNFLIAEEGPNSQRGARTWDSWLDRRESGK